MTLTVPQMISLVVFIVTYVGIMSNRIHRTVAAIVGAVIMVALVFPPAESLGLVLHYENWETLGLIFGMFTMVTGLRESGFFRWIGLLVVEKTKYNPIYIFFIFPFLAGFLSMFLDSITVMLFMATLSIEVGALIGLNPVSLIIVEICAANIGGSATMVGDPPNVIVGTTLGYSFMDFVVNTGPAAWVSWVITMIFFYFWYRKGLHKSRIEVRTRLDKNELKFTKPSEAIIDPWLFKVGVVDLGIAVALLTTHHITGLTVAQIGIIVASIILVFGGNPIKKTPEFLEKIDWLTLIFFGCLFIVVGGIEYTGIIEMAAQGIAQMAGNNMSIALGMIIWMSAFLSSVVDNVPFAATMAPLIKDLSMITGLELNPIAWSLSLGTDIGGNGTPIGASANVVGVAVAEKNKYPISWGTYCKVAYPSMIISVAACYAILLLRYVVL
ncbi:ArsB/NhaD family transporter [Candidatus Bathyarchaeota archaeon]|nr:ArsB/NhaD family transporter [Candidatus Bathyarchaeota archaeon]